MESRRPELPSRRIIWELQEIGLAIEHMLGIAVD
jgi:hypothetical protein